MPYIKPEDREDLLPTSLQAPVTAGELNFQITSLCLQYLEMNVSELNTRASYQLINDITGALINALLEFYRRLAAPYEDRKMRINGDVY